MFFDLFLSRSVTKVLIVLSAAAVGIASYTYFNQPQDNAIEECAEYVIRTETGCDFDLSPNSKEIK